MMQTDNRILDDLAKVATSALGTLQGVRHEVEDRLRERFERVLANMELVTREEFDAVRAMAAKARSENDDLRARLDALEAKIARSAKKPKTKKKPA
jgi:BMFP domain-containing protein YqiC